MSLFRKISWQKGTILTLVIGAALAFGLSTFYSTGNGSPVHAAAKETVVFDPMAISRIAEKAANAVVAIETTFKTSSRSNDPFFEDYQKFRRYFNLPDLPQEREAQKGYGSGFIVDSRGYVVTNYHVIKNAEKVQVRLLGDDKLYPAEVLDVNSEVDIAVIKIKTDKKMSFIPMGSSQNARVGEWVIAIGNPLGMEHTVTVGVLSAKDRQVVAQVGRQNQVYNNLLQTDAAINPGNSGGPLINIRGQVIGVNSMMNAAAQNLGFAQPIDNIKNFVHDVIKYGKSEQAWLGVAISAISNLDNDTKGYLGLGNSSSGLLVESVSPDSPAAKAGIERFDVIQEINKTPLKESIDLVDYIKKQKPGTVVTLLINRKGQVRAVKVELKEKPRID